MFGIYNISEINIKIDRPKKILKKGIKIKFPIKLNIDSGKPQ